MLSSVPVVFINSRDRAHLLHGSSRWIQVIWNSSLLSHENSHGHLIADCAWTPRYGRCATARAQGVLLDEAIILSGSGAVFVRDREMRRAEDEERADTWWNTNDWQTASSSGWWMTSGSGAEGCWTKSPRRRGEQVRIVVPLEVPRDTRICIEDLVDMETQFQIEQPRATTAKQELEQEPRSRKREGGGSPSTVRERDQHWSVISTKREEGSTNESKCSVHSQSRTRRMNS